MIFSVGVSMYSENVTSYWYRFRWRSLMSDEEDIARLLGSVGSFARCNVCVWIRAKDE